MKQIILLRHGESEGTAADVFQGSRMDPGLTEKGYGEARAAASRLKGKGIAQLDCAFCSGLKRSQQTLRTMLDELEQEDLEYTAAPELNEKDYGQLTGLNKDDARKRWGAEQVRLWRRSYAGVPPGGESLEMTARRVQRYFEAEVRPRLREGSTTLVVAHGNSLRCCMMLLEALNGEQVCSVELKTGVPYVYTLDESDKVVSREVLLR